MNAIESRDDFIRKFEEEAADIGDGFMMAMMTDKFDMKRLPCPEINKDDLFNKATEIRLFNRKKEGKWFRAGIDEPWRFRKRDDEKNPREYWDEYQYLDIDETESNFQEGRARAIGGGGYPLPLIGCTDENSNEPVESYQDLKVHIRNYLDYTDTGRVFISDWRVVGFVQKEEK